MLLRSCRFKWSFSFSEAFENFSNLRAISTNAAVFKVSEEVHTAVRARKPVVALETTIYTHGNVFRVYVPMFTFSDYV